uniref:Putative secreted protein n=1 Tax=Ixodes ricinus TaxID=34613 RepID=A0A6B0UTF5_IXORI
MFRAWIARFLLRSSMRARRAAGASPRLGSTNLAWSSRPASRERASCRCFQFLSPSSDSNDSVSWPLMSVRGTRSSSAGPSSSSGVPQSPEPSAAAAIATAGPRTGAGGFSPSSFCSSASSSWSRLAFSPSRRVRRLGPRCR